MGTLSRPGARLGVGPLLGRRVLKVGIKKNPCMIKTNVTVFMSTRPLKVDLRLIITRWVTVQSSILRSSLGSRPVSTPTNLMLTITLSVCLRKLWTLILPLLNSRFGTYPSRGTKSSSRLTSISLDSITLSRAVVRTTQSCSVPWSWSLIREERGALEGRDTTWYSSRLRLRNEKSR